MKSDDIVRRFVAARLDRNALKAHRDACLCERAETLEPTQEAPCWKAARQRTEPSDGDRFYLDPPPSAWCETCQRRQVLNDAYAKAVRAHAGALRGVIRHGRVLLGVHAVSAAESKQAAFEAAS